MHACVSVHLLARTCVDMRMNADALRSQGVGFSGSRVTGSCEPPDGGARNQTGPLQEQPVILTTKPSLHSLYQV